MCELLERKDFWKISYASYPKDPTVNCTYVHIEVTDMN